MRLLSLGLSLLALWPIGTTLSNMTYISPISGGSIGRTDQGVDYSAAPGTPVRAIATEQEVGIIPNWYAGQPFVWFRELGTNVYNYVAEQFSPNTRPGQIVQQGQQIGTVARSGTGLEFGFATASGRTLASATTGYREGQATPAGRSYRSQVFQGGSQNSLAQLWINNGGPPGVANIMAAIAMAESGGQNIKQQGQPAATTGWGLWQITPGDPSLLDPNANAKAAIAKYKSQGLSAWTTYTSGAYRAFLPNASSYVVGGGGVTRPGGDATQQAGGDVTGILADWSTAQSASGGSTGAPNSQFISYENAGLFGTFIPNPLDFFKALSGGVNDAVGFFKILAWVFNPLNILRMVEFLTGLALMLFGIQAMMQAYGEGREGFTTSESALSRSGIGRVSRELASAVTTAVPEARATKTVSRHRPAAAPHRTRRQALRLRYEREKQVSNRRTAERRRG